MGRDLRAVLLCNKLVSTDNPNVYGAIDVTVPPIVHWIDDCGLYNPWYYQVANNIMYNDHGWPIYCASNWHLPGSYYCSTALQMIHEDNRPLPGEPWKQYWTRHNPAGELVIVDELLCRQHRHRLHAHR